MQTIKAEYYNCKDYVAAKNLSGIISVIGDFRMSYIKIDKNKCKACYLCVNECPKKLIKISKETNSLGNHVVEFCDPNNECLGCAMCATRCPDLAIKEVLRT